MKRVEPIRDLEKIEEIKKLLLSRDNMRDLLFFVSGINFALRVSDHLELRVKDVFCEGAVRDYFDIVEKKTKKKNRIYITDSIKSVLHKYVLKYPYIIMDEENYLFFTKKGKSHYTTRWSGEILKKICKEVGIQDRICNHSLRKTWAYQARKNDVSLILIRDKLNHSNLRTTELYLGITEEELKSVCLDLNL